LQEAEIGVWKGKLFSRVQGFHLGKEEWGFGKRAEPPSFEPGTPGFP